MMRSLLPENPFTPTFGEVPVHMAGRAAALDEFKRAFNSARRHPSLTTAITGARGSGKTALLSLVAEEAEQRGWVAVKTVAMPGMLDDILITARREASHLIPPQDVLRLSKVGFGQVLDVELEHDKQPTNWRNEMSFVLDELAEHDVGLLIAVDEVQPTLDEMVQLAAIYQLFVTEGRKVALLMAGLPHNMLKLESDKTVSFLRRAQKLQLGRIADYDIEDAFRRTVEDQGFAIEDEALSMAVEAAGGFPFMMQLVGFRMWDQAGDNQILGESEAEAGIRLANAELKDRIIRTTYDSLSKGDRAFLRAMLPDAEASALGDIAARMGKTNSYATQYRNRLLGQGVIEENGRMLRFQLPLMREYVQEQAGA